MEPSDATSATQPPLSQPESSSESGRDAAAHLDELVARGDERGAMAFVARSLAPMLCMRTLEPVAVGRVLSAISEALSSANDAPRMRALRVGTAARLVWSGCIDVAQECKQQLGLHDAYTVFDVFVLNVINCLALHEIDRLSTGPAHATGEDGSTESFLFHLVRINDCSDATALARTVARLEEADVIDARVLLDVGLRMLYVLVVHGQCAGATTRGAAVQPLPPDRILDAVSRTLTIAAAIPGDAPLKATTSTLHHALYLLSVLSVQDANSMMRPFTVSCLFEWLEQHWLAIVPRAGTVSAGSLMAMSFLAVDRSHDAAILAWLWSVCGAVPSWSAVLTSLIKTIVWIEEAVEESASGAACERNDPGEQTQWLFERACASDKLWQISRNAHGRQLLVDLVGQFEKRAIVLAVPSLVGIMAVATRSIQTGATALDDALVQAAWSACMEHLGEPQDMRESWQAALLCTVVSLVNAAQDALERGEKVFSRTRAIAGMTLMQRIQAFFMIATGSCKQENAAVRDKTLAQSSADLNSRLNHAILSILVDSAAVDVFAQTPMLLDSLVWAVSKTQPLRGGAVEARCRTQVMTGLELMLAGIVRTAQCQGSTEAHRDAATRIVTKLQDGDAVHHNVLRALGGRDACDIVGSQQLLAAVVQSPAWREVGDEGGRCMLLQVWRAQLGALVDDLGDVANAAIAEGMWAVLDAAGAAAAGGLDGYLLDERWLGVVAELHTLVHPAPSSLQHQHQQHRPHDGPPQSTDSLPRSPSLLARGAAALRGRRSSSAPAGMLPDRHARPYRAPSFSPVLLARSASSPEPQLPQSRMPPAAALPAGPFSLAAQPSGARAADATPDADAAAAAAASLASGKLPRSVALDDQFDLLQFLAAAAPSDQAVPALTPTTPAGPAAAFGFLAAEPMPSLLTPASLRSPAFTPQASAVMLPHLLDAIASTLPPDAWDWASTEVDPAGREDGLDGRAAADESKPTLTIENVLTKDKRGCVVFNLYETEQSYANQLGIIQKMFRKGLTDRGIISDTAVNLIFGGTEELYQLHLRFFERLSNIVSVENWSTTESRIGGLFLEMKDEFVRLYTRFIDNYAISQKSMKKEEKANEDYQNFMKEMSKLRETNRQMLKEFLILPVQRTTRYHLLLKDLLKQTPQEHPDRPDLEQAWEAMNNLAAMVNEKKRKEEEATGLFDAFEATKNCPPQLISHKRRLIMRVDANERTSKRDVQLVLCSDSLMITMPTRTGVLGFARAVTEYPFKFVRWHHLMEIEINDPPGDDAGSGRDVLRITIDINKRPPDPDPQVVSTQTSDVTPKELGISQMQLVFIGPDAAKNRLSFRLAINGEMKALREARSNAAANAGAAGMSQGNIFNQADA